MFWPFITGRYILDFINDFFGRVDNILAIRFDIAFCGQGLIIFQQLATLGFQCPVKNDDTLEELLFLGKKTYQLLLLFF